MNRSDHIRRAETGEELADLLDAVAEIVQVDRAARLGECLRDGALESRRAAEEIRWLREAAAELVAIANAAEAMRRRSAARAA